MLLRHHGWSGLGLWRLRKLVNQVEGTCDGVDGLSRGGVLMCLQRGESATRGIQCDGRKLAGGRALRSLNTMESRHRFSDRLRCLHQCRGRTLLLQGAQALREILPCKLRGANEVVHQGLSFVHVR